MVKDPGLRQPHHQGQRQGLTCISGRPCGPVAPACSYFPPLSRLSPYGVHAPKSAVRTYRRNCLTRFRNCRKSHSVTNLLSIPVSLPACLSVHLSRVLVVLLLLLVEIEKLTPRIPLRLLPGGLKDWACFPISCSGKWSPSLAYSTHPGRHACCEDQGISIAKAPSSYLSLVSPTGHVFLLLIYSPSCT